MHQQYPHTLHGENLARHIRLGGGSRRAEVAARFFRCDRCAHAARPPARPIAAVATSRRFNECVGMGIAFMPDLRERQRAFLILPDLASDFTVANKFAEPFKKDGQTSL